MSAARVVLVGLPGAGKSAVGRALAARLGWRFVDVDAAIVEQEGISIAALFQRDGESAFRAMEARLTAELSSGPETVLATGGGWAAQPGSIESLPPDSAVVWLRISPGEAIRRLRGSPEVRPLLAGTDPLGALRALADIRTERYALADLTVDVDDMTVDAIAEIIDAWLKGRTS